MKTALSFYIISTLFSASPPETDTVFRDLHNAVTQTVSNLAQTSPLVFEPKTHLVVAIDFRGTWDASIRNITKQDVLASVYGALDTRGLHIHAPLTSKDYTKHKTIADAAQDTGADWLLILSLYKLEPQQIRLMGVIKKIDYGLWQPVPKPSPIYAKSQANINLSTKAPIQLDVVSKRFRKRHEIPERIVAMTNCNLDESNESNEVLTLSQDKLAVFRVDENILFRIGELNLRNYESSRSSSRTPNGYLQCNGRQLHFGHSKLRYGFIAVAEASNGKLKLSIKKKTNGIPVFANSSISFEATYEDSRPWWNSPSVLAGKRAFVPMPDAPSDTLGLTLNQAYQVEFLNADKKLRLSTVTSGLGLSLFTSASSTSHVVTTSSRSGERGDLIRIQNLNSGQVIQQWETKTPTYASTVLASKSGNVHTVFIASFPLDRKRSTISSVEFLPE